MNGFISGFIDGLTLILNNDVNTRKMFALYLLSRAYDAGLQTLKTKKVIDGIPHGTMIFNMSVSLSWIFIYFADHNLFSPSYYAILNNFFAVHKAPNDHIMQNIIRGICSK